MIGGIRETQEGDSGRDPLEVGSEASKEQESILLLDENDYFLLDFDESSLEFRDHL